jgi:hypothetical protein
MAERRTSSTEVSRARRAPAVRRELASSDISRPRITGPLVVAGWGAGNGLLTALQAGMGAAWTVVVMQGCSAIVIELIAITAMLAWRRWPEGRPRQQPPGGATVMLIAAGALTGGLGLAYGIWVTVISIALFIAAGLSEAHLAHRRVRLRSVPPGTGYRLPPQR